LRSLFFHGSGEACPEGCGTDQIDGPNDIVGEHAERCFTTDFSKSPGEEPPASGHSFYGSEVQKRIGAGGSGSIGLETGVHSFERIFMLMATDKATLCGGTSRLE
jgi:hypothetical protein